MDSKKVTLLLMVALVFVATIAPSLVEAFAFSNQRIAAETVDAYIQ